MKAVKLILCIIGVAVTFILPQISFCDVSYNINVGQPAPAETPAGTEVVQRAVEEAAKQRPPVPGEGGFSITQMISFLQDVKNPAFAAEVNGLAEEFTQFANERVGNENRLGQLIRNLIGSGKVSRDAIDEVIAKAGLVNAINLARGAVFTVAGQKLSEIEGVTDESILLANLAEINAVDRAMSAATSSAAHDFDSVTVNTVLYKEGFVVNTPEAFRDAFKALTNGETAVIIATDEDAALVAIRAALAKEGVDLLPQLGKRIVIMAVKTGSAAATAFNDLFGQENMYDLRNNRTKDILDNKKLIAGLQGAI